MMKKNSVPWSDLASSVDFSLYEEHDAHEVSKGSKGTQFELTSCGDVILYVTIHATAVTQCVLSVSQQWDLQVKVTQVAPRTWVAELVNNGLPTIFIKGNCFNSISNVFITGTDIHRVTCTVAIIEDPNNRKTIFHNTRSLRIDTVEGPKYIFRTLD